jgi:hypothetical protein
MTMSVLLYLSRESMASSGLTILVMVLLLLLFEYPSKTSSLHSFPLTTYMSMKRCILMYTLICVFQVHVI